MKKIIIAIGVLFAAAPVMAQTQPLPQRPSRAQTEQSPGQQQAQTEQAPQAKRQLPPPEKRAIMYTDQLKKDLNLTDDQYQKVLQVNTECIKRKDAAKDAGGDERQSMKDIAMYRREQFQGILSTDQMAKLKEMNQQRRGNRGGGDASMKDMPMNNETK
ncbi:hypothetical protein ACTHGU_06610 [Chitinophagaceae bacterium MMS25-I14]